VLISLALFRAAVELGWKNSMYSLAEMLRDGEGCAKDLRQAVIWGAKRNSFVFWDLLGDAKRALESGATDKLDYDFNQFCYSIGWGLYWYIYSELRDGKCGEGLAFRNYCLDYYCRCVELQQKSIFTFLLFWNRTTGGIKGPGQMIAQMVWDGRENALVKTFEKRDGKEEPRLKRIKK
jgi:hypothetical protein